ncbi:cation diffusion facilitator family transporter [Gordoniibacillus kamchatkensis]|uniref:cation diffusion facilitator family transporter n=1 Tax=Gordoniibacillus kamchatkensis TaxID=1590651 RepID=UPI0009E387ED|nr:cation diffusion facilitator family transporter [Paenibacillus sp. VKM B-2647]
MSQHHDHHHHDHEHCRHGHSHGPGGHVHVAQSKLKIAVLLGLIVLAAETIGGLWANSLALLSDAGHMLTDVAALIVALIAMKISANPPSRAMTYGYHRATILAALFNAITLVVIVIYIGFEAYKRMLHPEPVQGAVLFVTAALGIAVNLYIGLGMRDHADNVNVRSAMLHVFGDAAASAGVIVAGVIMYFTKWYILDPILSVLIALIVAAGAWRVMKETYVVLMEGTPMGIDFDEVVKAIQAVPGVKEIHDLHIWCLTSNRNAMSGHIVVDGDVTVREAQHIIREIDATVAKKFKIGHSTLQIEDDAHAHDNEMFGIDRNWNH